MKLISPSWEIIKEDNIYKKIELCGRVAYKSEDKITSSSHEGFIRHLIKRGHESVLEHGDITLAVDYPLYELIHRVESSQNSLPYLWQKSDCYLKYSTRYNINIVSGNIRAWRNLLRKDLWRDCNLASLLAWFHLHYPLFVEKWNLAEDQPISNTRITEVPSATLGLKEELEQHHRVSVRFICDRGISHEIVRHRPCSFTQESTRFVAYHGDIEYIIPDPAYKEQIEQFGDYIKDEDLYQRGILITADLQYFLSLLSYAEKTYQFLLKEGWKPQKARSVLPNALKTEIIVTANLAEWKHIFKLRAAPDAHPQMLQLMIPLQAEFAKLYPSVFTKIYPLGSI